MTAESTEPRALLEAARLVWRLLASEREMFPAEQLRCRLREIVDEGALDEVLEAGARSATSKPGEPDSDVSASIGDAKRRHEGIFLTPRELADALAAPVEQLEDGEAVLDLSCGAGALLLAAARRSPSVRAVGVEKQTSLAVAAAARLVALRERQGWPCGDRIFVGDGLAAGGALSNLQGEVGLALGNPPYVREKGNRERFRQLRQAHPHLDAYWAGRMDLQYLFFHRSIDFLRPGGWLAFLTSSYWLTATNARRLREDLVARAAPRLLVEIEQAGVFEDAPGHHTLLTFARCSERDVPAWSITVSTAREVDRDALVRGAGGAQPGETWYEVPTEELSSESWAPFVDVDTRSWGKYWSERGTALESVLQDRQGFVSGADAVNPWNEKHLDEPLERGTPIFVYSDAPPASLGRAHGTVIRPLLRGSTLSANQVITTPPDDAFGLYIDQEVGERGEELLEEILGPYRAILERRREVRNGSMPWYRLHWPRVREEQTRPKLVVARRSKAPRVALDLSGSAVSSDCTYLLAPEDARTPIEMLVLAMVLLNRPETERYLREFGKSKGELLEFYSEPLRRLPLPVHYREGELQLVEELLGAEATRQIRQTSRDILAGLA